MRSLVFFIFGTLVFPLFLHAQIIFSEVMYDLDGSDADREWVEVYNNGANALDISSWRFFEGDSNHKLSVSKGAALLPPNAYAVIADDATTFLSDYPSFNGTLFDSSFSLSNSGEKLIIRNADLNDIDTVTYSSDWGAAGDGNSLTLNGNSWFAESPTPGGGTLGSSGSDGTEETGNNTTTETGPGTSSETNDNEDNIPRAQEREFIVVDMGKDRVVTVGAAEFFEAKSYKEDGEPHPYVAYTWNFGNGVVREGQKVLHQYNYPGDYVVWVSGVTADKLSATKRIVVSALPADIVVSSVRNDHMTLTNNSNRELDLSLWSLRGGKNHFMFPEHTIVLPDTTVTFRNAITGINTSNPKQVALLYPNGMIASMLENASQQGMLASQTAVLQELTLESGTEAPAHEDVSTRSQNVPLAIAQQQEENTPLLNTAVAGTITGAASDTALYVSLLALLGVLGVAIIAVLMTHPNTAITTEDASVVQLTANDFTIIEEKEKTEKP